MFHDADSLSMKTGSAPQYVTALAVAANVKVDTNTRSPVPTPTDNSARWSDGRTPTPRVTSAHLRGGRFVPASGSSRRVHYRISGVARIDWTYRICRLRRGLCHITTVGLACARRLK